MIEFLSEGAKVKATIMFRGREMAHRDLGIKMMDRLIREVGELGQVESRPRVEGPNLSALLAAKKVVAKVGKTSPTEAAPGGPSPGAPAPTKRPLRPAAGPPVAAVVPEASKSPES